MTTTILRNRPWWTWKPIQWHLRLNEWATIYKTLLHCLEPFCALHHFSWCVSSHSSIIIISYYCEESFVHGLHIVHVFVEVYRISGPGCGIHIFFTLVLVCLLNCIWSIWFSWGISYGLVLSNYWLSFPNYRYIHGFHWHTITNAETYVFLHHAKIQAKFLHICNHTNDEDFCRVIP